MFRRSNRHDTTRGQFPLMRQSLRMGLRFLSVMVLVVFSGAAVLTCYGFVIESQSISLLNDLTALEVGKSTGIEARQFAQRHQRQIFQSSNPCDNDTCAMIFTVQNTWLSKLRVEPPAKFEVNFSVRNGTVDAIGAYLLRSMPIYPTFQGSAGDVTETVEMPRSLRSSPHYFFPTPVGKPYLRVSLDSHASPIQRQHAFEFSFWCLVKPGGGCDLPCDYLPSAWQDWKVSLLDSGFPVYDFDEYYPKNVRCKR
jgi:hypothetical protein